MVEGLVMPLNKACIIKRCETFIIPNGVGDTARQ